MKKPQWITLFIAIILTGSIYLFGKKVPARKTILTGQHGPNDGHDHGETTYTIDTALNLEKKKLPEQQVMRLNTLEHSISRGDVKAQQLDVYHQLAHFWADTARAFEPWAWYEAEAARLENSEKTLTFAAHLFLDNLQNDEVPARRKWKALQAKDLFERSLKVNPSNDSSKVGLGATYLFGNISTNPMEGILKIREVVEKDSGHIYAQIMLSKGSIISGQYDKAITRLQTVNRLNPTDVDAMLLLAEVYERMGDKLNAVNWYRKCLPYVKLAPTRTAIEKRIEELNK